MISAFVRTYSAYSAWSEALSHLLSFYSANNKDLVKNVISTPS